MRNKQTWVQLRGAGVEGNESMGEMPLGELIVTSFRPEQGLMMTEILIEMLKSLRRNWNDSECHSKVE